MMALIQPPSNSRAIPLVAPEQTSDRARIAGLEQRIEDLTAIMDEVLQEARAAHHAVVDSNAIPPETAAILGGSLGRIVRMLTVG